MQVLMKTILIIGSKKEMIEEEKLMVVARDSDEIKEQTVS